VVPVGGLIFEVREPIGEDELFLLETSLPPVEAIVDLAGRVTIHPGGASPDWGTLPAVDLGRVALAIRQSWVGDLVVSEGVCPKHGCGERFDVSFGIATYLSHHRPRRPRSVSTMGEDGWYRLVGTAVRFRVPTVEDLLAAAADEQPALALASRCVDPPGVPSAVARRVDRALAALAPSLDGFVGGGCPSCGAELILRFDPLAYPLAELRDAFAGIYRETHALASSYGWPEETILRLPRSRRVRYAAMILEERSLA
jgi:hypothetical protein